MNFEELLLLANALDIPVRECTSHWNSYYAGGPGDEAEQIQTTRVPFILAHEIAHATGSASRLNRHAICWKRPGPFWWQDRIHRTIVRAEEALADQVATCLTGQLRQETPACIGAYPPVRPLTRTEHYVNVRAYEALEYLMPYIQQIQERKAA